MRNARDDVLGHAQTLGDQFGANAIIPQRSRLIDKFGAAAGSWRLVAGPVAPWAPDGCGGVLARLLGALASGAVHCVRIPLHFRNDR